MAGPALALHCSWYRLTLWFRSPVQSTVNILNPKNGVLLGEELVVWGFFLLLLFFSFSELGIEPRTSCVLGRHRTTKLQAQ